MVELGTDLKVAGSMPRFERADVADSVRRAMENSYLLNAARAARRTRQMPPVDVARGAFRPGVDLRFSHGREISRPGSELDPVSGDPVVQSNHSRGDTTAIFKQMLIDFSASAEMDQVALARSSNLSIADAPVNR
ncbi:MAG: hypothetical protein R3E87_13395 [Burkholderiaceae bacterium]